MTPGSGRDSAARRRDEVIAGRAAMLCDYGDCCEQAAYLMAALACIPRVQARLKKRSATMYYLGRQLFDKNMPIYAKSSWAELRAVLDAWAIEAVGAERWRAQLRRAETCAGRLVDMLWRHQLDRRRARQRRVSPDEHDD